MPWGRTVKRNLLARCGRFCCVCGKFCGTKIEIDHIVPESEGGASDEANGIPVCFDCHQDVKSYNPQHPRGTKFTKEELRLHRERAFYLVESGAIYRTRSLLDSGICPSTAPDEWRSTQTSTVCSYDFPFPIPVAHGEVDTATVKKLLARLQHLIGLSYWVTSTTTPYDDFVYLLSFEPTDVPFDGFKIYRVALQCHLTRFVLMFQKQCQRELESQEVAVPAEIALAPNDLEMTMNVAAGSLVPHRISRYAARGIWIRELITRPLECPPIGTTSGLLTILHAILTNKMIIWDDFKLTDESEKAIRFFTTVADRGTFSFDQVKLDRQDPEHWEVLRL